MLRKSLMILSVLLLLLPFVAVAQDAAAAAGMGGVRAGEGPKEFLLDTFEDEGHWHASISNDVGYPTVKYIEGSPIEKKPEKEDQAGNTDIVDAKVLGVKIDFIKRAWVPIIIKPDTPIEIRGLTRSFSFFTIGRQYNHNLSVLLKNYDGRDFVIPVGRIDHYGWQKMTVDIPVTIDQQDPNYPARGGLEFVGFLIDLNPMEIRGDFYVYFDDLRVVTDLKYEEYDEPDDIKDTW